MKKKPKTIVLHQYSIDVEGLSDLEKARVIVKALEPLQYYEHGFNDLKDRINVWWRTAEDI